MDIFRKIIESGFNGFSTSDARSIIRNSEEVSRYVNDKKEHLRYVEQLMHDDIIDSAMNRVKQKEILFTMRKVLNIVRIITIIDKVECCWRSHLLTKVVIVQYSKIAWRLVLKQWKGK